jgi:hypothetical protein
MNLKKVKKNKTYAEVSVNKSLHTRTSTMPVSNNVSNKIKATVPKPTKALDGGKAYEKTEKTGFQKFLSGFTSLFSRNRVEADFTQIKGTFSENPAFNKLSGDGEKSLEKNVSLSRDSSSVTSFSGDAKVAKGGFVHLVKMAQEKNQTIKENSLASSPSENSTVTADNSKQSSLKQRTSSVSPESVGPKSEGSRFSRVASTVMKSLTPLSKDEKLRLKEEEKISKMSPQEKERYSLQKLLYQPDHSLPEADRKMKIDAFKNNLLAEISRDTNSVEKTEGTESVPAPIKLLTNNEISFLKSVKENYNLQDNSLAQAALLLVSRDPQKSLIKDSDLKMSKITSLKQAQDTLKQSIETATYSFNKEDRTKAHEELNGLASIHIHATILESIFSNHSSIQTLLSVPGGLDSFLDNPKSSLEKIIHGKDKAEIDKKVDTSLRVAFGGLMRALAALKEPK